MTDPGVIGRLGGVTAEAAPNRIENEKPRPDC
jgi:hypothetical protein